MTHVRSHSMRTAARTLWLAALLLALLGALRPAAVHAATINVAAGEVTINNNGQCSLREAIINANTDAATHGDCLAGSGSDVLNLSAGSTYSVPDIYTSYSGNTGLPQITTNITIEGNGATIDRSGSSVYRLLAISSAGNLTLNDLTLTDGSMTTDVGGGALYNAGGTVTINDSTLNGHTASTSQGGGAIRMAGGSITINTSTVSNNTAANSNGGGGIYATGSATVNINDSTFNGNGASNTSGGAIALDNTSHTVTINRSTLGNNNTANAGGALALNGGAVTLNNATVSSNVAQSAGGGGLYNNGGTLTLNNTTVAGNQTTGGGGGILSNSGTLNLNRSIVSGNTGNTGYDSGYEVVSYGTENVDKYNVFGHSGITTNRAFAFSLTPGANDVNATSNGATPTALAGILNTTLANNGGPTNTHALVANSPAVDRAPSVDCTAAPINGVDQRGYPRNVDGNAAASANECDAGAFEYLSSPPPTTGTIVIVKAADPADDTEFDFTETVTPGGFTLTDPADDTETFSDVPAGDYTFIETPAAGWTLDDIDCDDPTADTTEDESGGTAVVDLTAGETVTCTFYNSRDTGTVVIVKDADPADDTPFDFTETLPGAGSGFTLTDPADNNETFNDVPTGSYTVTETGETGWTLDDITCDDLNSSGSTGTGEATINVEKDETVTCTFSNSRDTGTVVIVKDADPADDTPFDFTENLPGAGSGFTLTDPADNTETFNDVPTGSYTVTETGETGWTLDDITCDDLNSSGSTGTGQATINVEKDETVTCTFSNSRDTGTVVIVKDADPADDTPFGFTDNIPGSSGAFTLMDPSDDTETFNNVPTGSYSVAENVPAGWLLDDLVCDDANSTESIATATATINLEKDETVNCTFSNGKIAPPPTADVFVSATEAGETDDGVVFGPHDILQWDGSGWSKWFDGTAAGLAPSGKFKHDIDAVWIPDPAGDDVWFSFTQNDRIVPGIAPKVDGMDLVLWDGLSFSLVFDGQDVGLTNKTEEKVDALHVLPGASSPIGAGCVNYLLVSTQGPGKVPNYSGGTLNFGGEDVLGFCQTGVGATTTGLWHMVLDGSAEGMPRNSTSSISFSDDGQTMYLTTDKTFNVDSAVGGHSMIYVYDFASGTFSGPIFVAANNGLDVKVDALHFEEIP